MVCVAADGMETASTLCFYQKIHDTEAPGPSNRPGFNTAAPSATHEEHSNAASPQESINSPQPLCAPDSSPSNDCKVTHVTQNIMIVMIVTANAVNQHHL